MRALTFALTLGLAACSTPPANNGNNTASGSPTTGTTATTGLPGTGGTVTQPQGTNYGSLMLVRKENQQETPPTVELAAIFPTNDPGYRNLAQCALIGGTCLTQLPDQEDTAIQVDPEREFDGLQYDYSFAGTDVGFGPLRAWFTQGLVPHYYANYTADYAEEGFDGHYGVKIGGEWGDYEGWDDILVSPAMNVMSHFAGQNIGFHDGQTVVFEWEPRGEGDVYLNMNADDGTFTQMWLLEDDGYFELDVDSLNLGYDEIEFKISISRWNSNRVDINGNTLDVVSISEVAWNGTYFYVGGRDAMVAADTCGDTNTMNEYLTGQYWGRLQDWGYDDNMNPGFNNTCTGYQATGMEGFVYFDLDPATHLSLTMNLLDDDASLYLVRDCNDDNTCINGSDVGLLGEDESIQYFNASEDVETVYAVLDGFNGTNGLFYLDVAINPMLAPPMHDTCANAIAQTAPIAAGGYYSSATAYTNQLDPFDGGCLPTSSPGPDAMTKVEVPAGATLSVNVQMANEDPALYLLGNCQSTSGCAAWSDSSVGTTENMIYVNTGTTAQTMYLVVDTKALMEPYFLTVSF